jgi:hypothetical protein
MYRNRDNKVLVIGSLVIPVFKTPVCPTCGDDPTAMEERPNAQATTCRVDMPYYGDTVGPVIDTWVPVAGGNHRDHRTGMWPFFSH